MTASRLSILVSLAALAGATPARADDLPPSPPPVPPPVDVAPPPSPPPPADDPLAVQMTIQAHAAAVRSDCEQVEVFAYKVRTLSPDVYRRHFATDAAIVHCDPRVSRAERAAGWAPRYHETGFALALGASVARALAPQQPIVNFSAISLGAQSSVFAPTMRAFVGYQGQTVELGGTLAYARQTQADSSSSVTTTFTTTQFAVGPSGRLAVWRSHDARAELRLAADVAIGTLSQSQSPDPGTTMPASEMTYELRLGLGLRYWLAPSFAVGVGSSLQIDWLQISQDTGGGTTQDSDTTLTMLVNQLEITGVF